MKIISHRGKGIEGLASPNSLISLNTSLKYGFGIETDIRDYCERLVISHDIGNHLSPSLEAFFMACRPYSSLPLALNIKADGIAYQLRDLLDRCEISEYFTFDMSFPQMLEYVDAGLIVFTRQSEYEASPLLYEKAAGVWIDAFIQDEWIRPELIQGHIYANKRVCIVSPELHGREHMHLWQRFKAANLSDAALCTDYPLQADIFFNEKE